MKERAISFSAPMVRPTLAGTKTQTRRMVAMPRSRDSFVLEDRGDGWWPYQSDDAESSLCNDGMEHPYTSPYGQPGDRLWVREAWRAPAEFDRVKPSDLRAPGDGLLGTPIIYEASRHESVQFGKLRPGIFMPRWASRITLEVTGVRVERLQDISEADCYAESVVGNKVGRLHTFEVPCTGIEKLSPQCAYGALWDEINGPGSWDANPWVWVVAFKRLEALDAMP